MPSFFPVEWKHGDNALHVDLPATEIRGRVVDSAGEPCVGLRVHATWPQGKGWREWFRTHGARIAWTEDPVKWDPMVNPSLWVVTDAQGTFRLPGVPTGEAIHVQASGDPWLDARSELLKLEPGAQEVDLEVLANPAGCLRVRYKTADGVPVSAACIEVVPVQDLTGNKPVLTQRQVGTNQDGVAEIQGLAAGEYEVRRRPWQLAFHESRVNPKAGFAKPERIRIVRGEWAEITLQP